MTHILCGDRAEPASVGPTLSMDLVAVGWKGATMIPKIPQANADALLKAARALDEAPFTRQELEHQARADHKA